MTSRCIINLFVNEFNEFEGTKCLEQLNFINLVIMIKTTSAWKICQIDKVKLVINELMVYSKIKYASNQNNKYKKTCANQFSNWNWTC